MDPDRGVRAAAETSIKPRALITTVVPLRPWIKRAIHSISHSQGERAATSRVYLDSALNIAKSLANQIIQAEELYDRFGISTKLDSLSVGHDWAEHVHVTVQLDDDESDYNNLAGFNYDLAPLPENEELELYLQSLEKNMSIKRETVADHATMDRHDNDNAESKSAGESFERADALKKEQKYLQISSAQIQCPDGKCVSKYDDPVKENSKRIYYLGLVLYEIFTGGEIPPSNLRAIALCESAFVSLSTLTLVNKNSESDKNIPPSHGNNKRHQGQSASSDGDLGLCELSCEYLRLTGIASPICNLILNMLDSVYGDLVGNESYTSMTQVASDLQLMIDKPCKFLRGLDMDKFSAFGLPIQEIEIPREEEFEAIKCCYNRSISGSSEIAIIRGESGTGKSWLAYCVGKFVISDGGLVLIGKFDQMHQTKPFSALASAFDQYCDLLLGSDDDAMVQSIADNLQLALGQNVYPLFEMIPKLKNILGKSIDLNEINRDNDFIEIGGNEMLRLSHLISTFIDIISTNSAVSVVLFMDDLQWIDEASLSVLKTALRQKHRKFFFMGCYRDDEISTDSSFWNMKLEDFTKVAGVTATEIKLNCINEETVRTVVSDLLCISPRLVGSLSSVLFSRSKGNVLFFMQLLLLLYRDGMLYLDLGSQRWKWDDDKIVSLKLPDNIAICLSNGIGKLSIEVQLALNTLSMFGASAKLSYLKLLESNLHMRIIEPLKDAEEEGLVTNTKGSFKFCHDRIQEASLNLTEEQYRSINHLAYGKCLVQTALVTNDVDLFFTAVEQINFGGPSAITEHQDYFVMANYNLAAGKRAMSMAEFTSALSFFEHGISFLRDGHWQEHYVFSLEIYELACKSSVASCKNVLALSVFSEQVIKNARTFEDTLEVKLIIIEILAYSDLAEAVENGLSILSKLGEEIPPINQEALDLKQEQSIIEGVSPENLLNYIIMDNAKMLIVMRFLARIQIIAHQCKPELNPLVTRKMLQITISYGLSPQAPLTFAYFGSLIAKLGDLQEGYRYALLAMALVNKLGVLQQMGEVFALVSGIQYYCEPSPAVLEAQIQNETTLISQGDMYWACLNRINYCNNALWVNRDLLSVNKIYSNARVFFKQQEHKLGLAMNAIGHRVVLAVMGRENEAIQIALDNRLPLIRDMPIPSLKRSLFFYDLYLSYLMTQGNLKECLEAFLTTEIKEYILAITRAYRAFIVGLAAYQVYRETRDSIWKDIGTEHTKEMRIWAECGSSWNFEHKLLLMEAESYHCNGNLVQAAESYDKAIASAKAHRYINDEAMACELAGRFFLDRCNINLSLKYLRLAHEKYSEWKAVGKANQLMNFINVNFPVGCNS